MATIHAARFGNRDGAHDVLADSGAPRAVLDGIKWFTDRPGTRWTTGEDWAHAGYSHQDHYVIQATRLDEQAPRGGMVSTTALLVPDAFLSVVDLGSAFATVDALAEQDMVRVVDVADLRPDSPCPHAPGAAALGEALASAGEAVWHGPGDCPALACLWRHLAIDDRRRLAFTVTDHPGAVALPRSQDRLRVLIAPTPVPTALAGFPSVGEGTESASDMATAMFGTEAHPVRQLANRLGTRQPGLREWGLLLKAKRELDALTEGRAENTFAALFLLGRLAPNPVTGADLKGELIERLRGQLSDLPYAKVRPLRNVPWAAMPATGEPQHLVEGWVRQAAANRDTASLATAAGDLGQYGDAWFPGLRYALHTVLAADSHVAAAVIGQLLLQADGRDILQALLHELALGTTPEFDGVVQAAVAGRPAPQWAADEASSRGWPLTHASVVSIGNPVRAWRAHLPVATPASLRTLAGRIPPAGTVAAALVLDDPSLVDLAGLLVSESPELLSPPRPKEAGYRRVWTAATRKGMAPSACCPLDVAAPAVADALLSGTGVDEVLVAAVSDYVIPILATHPDRERLWTLPASPLISGLRAAVAAHVARDLKPGIALLERQLAQEILARPRLVALARERPAQAVTVLEVLHGLALDWHGALVAERMTMVTPEVARRMGILVRDRRWHQTARYLVSCGRSDLVPAAEQAASILGLFDRLRMQGRAGMALIPEPNDTEFRDAVIGVLTKVYPFGPPEELWERAGGSVADLPEPGTGRQRWEKALAMIATGHTGTPSLSQLLKRAADAHNRNEELGILHRHAAKRAMGGNR